MVEQVIPERRSNGGVSVFIGLLGLLAVLWILTRGIVATWQHDLEWLLPEFYPRFRYWFAAFAISVALLTFVVMVALRAIQRIVGWFAGLSLIRRRGMDIDIDH